MTDVSRDRRRPASRQTHPKQEPQMNWTLEVAVIPVTDVDRAKAVYSDKLGVNVHADTGMGDSFRNVQTTPPGSGCSVTFGTGLTPGLQLCVQDITAAHEELSSRGAQVARTRH